ncbi:MAG: transcriptional activator RfaH, partial [Proteobacteria bacterium]|nr:transcriptional activator RfaH [Pseudomonadota bacterium]MBU1711274.1 transcriptional activator RfaH [Pseudomonadota bacterium]
MSAQWFAIRTKPNKEFLAKEQYEKQGFEVYLPITRRIVSHARKKTVKNKPFFPGYLFLYLKPEEQRWTTIASTIGSLGPVKFGENYPSVPEAVIHSLQSFENDQGHIAVSDAFEPGTKIRVFKGELEGFDGIFLESRGDDRAII